VARTIRKVRSIVVDDSAAVRARVIALLRDAGVSVVGEAADAPHALRLAREHGAELVVMDLHMPGMNGFELASALKTLEPPPIVMVLTNEPLELYRIELERLGVDFFFDKSKDTDRVIAAVTTARTRKS
jgi:DNA-binding NarL/FixJ family response regulator